MLDDYTRGKIAAHAYVDELQRLNLGYEALVEKTAQGYGQALPADVKKIDPKAAAQSTVDIFRKAIKGK